MCPNPSKKKCRGCRLASPAEDHQCTLKCASTGVLPHRGPLVQAAIPAALHSTTKKTSARARQEVKRSPGSSCRQLLRSVSAPPAPSHFRCRVHVLDRTSCANGPTPIRSTHAKVLQFLYTNFPSVHSSNLAVLSICTFSAIRKCFGVTS